MLKKFLRLLEDLVLYRTWIRWMEIKFVSM